MSVTAPAGFAAAGVACGIKPGGEPDLSLVACDVAATSAAVFTTNRAAAPPVLVSRRHLATAGTTRAIVANSGCANAGTGVAGEAHAVEMAQVTADLLRCRTDEVLVASTGPIGPVLPMGEVREGIVAAHQALSSSAESARDAATAVLTTDQVVKEVSIDAGGFTVGGMAKGSGMIRPDMATMLCFLTTDARVDALELHSALRAAVDDSFHSLNIDGCPSTNDTVVALASGASARAVDQSVLRAAMRDVCADLSAAMAADAEGARRVISLEVTGAVDDATARAAGRAIADSALVRASFFGGDPNWGRLLGALGASGLPFDVDSFGVTYQGLVVAEGGIALDYDTGAVLSAMESGDLTVGVTIGTGAGRATVLTTDLTPDYVTFNGERS